MSLNMRGSLHTKIASRGFRGLIQGHDLVVLTETGRHPLGQVHGYRTIHMPRRTPGEQVDHVGGVAILISNRIARYCRVIRQHAELGILWLVARLPQCAPIYMAGCYIPPASSSYFRKHTHTSAKVHFKTLAEEVLHFQGLGYVLVTGDLNSRTGLLEDHNISHAANLEGGPYSIPLPERRSCDPGVCQNGRKLVKLCADTGIAILNGRLPGDRNDEGGGQVTFHREGQKVGPRSSLVDYFVGSPNMFFDGGGNSRKGARLRVLAFESTSTPDINSDHAAVTLRFHPLRGEGGEGDDPPPRFRVPKDRVRAVCRQLDGEDLRDRLAAVGTLDMSIEDAVQTITEVATLAMTRAHKEHGGIIATSQGLDSSRPQNTWYNEACREARAQWLEARTALGQTSLGARAAKSRYRSVTRRERRAFEERKGMELAQRWFDNPRTFWSSFKGPLGGCAIQDIEGWADYFSGLLGSQPIAGDPLHDYVWPMPTDSAIHRAQVLNDPVTTAEVYAALTKLKAGRAGGVDNIPGEILRPFWADKEEDCSPLPQEVWVPVLARLFSRILHSKEYPAQWRIGAITPVPKAKGSHVERDSYRGITVRSVLAKIFSMVLGARMNKWAEEEGHRASGQFGFREGMGPVQAAFVLRHAIELHTQQKKPLYCAFVDFRKAYDSVDRNLLWKSLIGLGVSDELLGTLQSMYASVAMRVRLGGRLSKEFLAHTGVMQGDPMSPLLFGLFIDRIESFFIDRIGEEAGCKVADSICRLLLFADDLVLMGGTPEELTCILELLSEFCIIHRLTVNVAKSEVVIFNRPAGLEVEHKWKYQGQELPVVSEFSYLGILFRESSSFSGANAAFRQQMVKAEACLHGMFRRCATLHLHHVATVSHLYDVLVRSVQDYGCEIWAPGMLSKVKGLKMDGEHERILKMFMRRALGVRDATSNEILLAELGRRPTWSKWMNQCVKFWNSCIDRPHNDLCHRALRENVGLAIDRRSRNCWAYEFLTCMINLGVLDRMSAVRTQQGDGSWVLRHIELSKCEAAVEEWWEKSWERAASRAPRSMSTQRQGIRTTVYAAWMRLPPAGDKHDTYVAHLLHKRDILNVARFRTGAHDLRTVSDSWKCRRRGCAPPPSARVCRECSAQTVEDEFHVMLECPCYHEARLRFLQARGLPESMDPSDGNMQMVMHCTTKKDWQALAGFLREVKVLRQGG